MALLLATWPLPACRRRSPVPPPDAAPARAGDLDRARRLALIRVEPAGPADLALARLEARAAAHPSEVDAWIALGHAWIRRARERVEPGHHVNADACAELALAIKPEHPLALGLRALVLLNDHRFEEARALAERVTGLRPDEPMAWGTLSDALLELGRIDPAIDAAQRMVSLKPNLPSYARASYLRWLQGDREAAKRLIRLAIDAGAGAADPEPRAWAIVQAALYFFHEGDYAGADVGFDRALEALPGYPPALVGKGRVALSQEAWGRAAELLTRAYAASPLVETAWLLGEARVRAGDQAGARAAFDRVEQTGRRADPRALALYLAVNDQRPAEALALASEERQRRGDVYTLDAYAWAAFRAGKLAEAAAAAEEAIRPGTPDARLLYHAGAIQLARGEREAGRALVRRALALSPRFDPVEAPAARRLIGDVPD